MPRRHLRAGALVPKTPSTALYLELLDASGAPTWMARDVQQLVQLASGQPAQQKLSSTLAADQQQQSEDVSDSESERDGEGQHNEGEGGQEKAQQGQKEEDEVDVDTLLAMAAAEVRKTALGCLQAE